MLIRDPDETSRLLHALRDVGVQIAIDDFGTGFSSLNYLRHLPVTALKLDQSFVSGISVNPSDKAIAETVIFLARAMRLRVVAEGVETEAQRSTLRELGCECAQGYLFSRPVAPDALRAVLGKQAVLG
jgi:EAL domain-containing protein (putative c-di-GMP-specific phosphodiesterase class I)